MKRKAGGAVLSQAAQAAASLALQILVIRLLGIEEYGRFAIFFGVLILAAGILTGLVGDAIVVLDRRELSVRAGLQAVLLVAVVVLAISAGSIAWASGFGSVAEAIFFCVALAAFGVEEVIRRLLMAHMLFLQVAAADVLSFSVVFTVVVISFATDSLSLSVLLAAIAVGQSVAILVGWRLVPASDRRLVRVRHPAWRAVLRYGSWRALQQVLRPSLFTIVRLMVLIGAGAGVVGLLEAARTYASPLLLVVSGLSSFLFVRFAGQKAASARSLLREADRMVLRLVVATAVMSGFAAMLIPWAGPLIFGLHVESITVVAWLLYGMSVAFVTPYGAVGAVRGKQVGIFLIRLADTTLAVLVTVLLLALGAPAAIVPFGLAVASALGGILLRRLVVSGEEGVAREGSP